MMGYVVPMNASSNAATSGRATTIYRTLGLSSDPFTHESQSGAWVPLASHQRALDTLGEWLADSDDAQSGLAAVSGAHGAGKTHLLHALVTSLAGNADRLVGVVPDDGSRRSDAQLLRATISALGGSPAGRTGLELTTAARGILAAHRGDARPPVLMIDNAALTGSQLEIVRALLAPQEADDPPTRVQIVLFGPPELPDRVNRRRSLAGFVRRGVVIGPLEASAIDRLLQARIDEVREPGSPTTLLTGEASAVIWRSSGGYPGLAIALAHGALREAIASGAGQIDAVLAERVAEAWAKQALPASRTRAGDGETAIQTRLSLPGFEEVAEPARRRRRQQ